MATAKNLFFISMTTIISLFTGAMSIASAQTTSKNHVVSTVHHGKKTTKVSNPNAVVQAERLHKTANLSYKVAGKRYYPLQKVANFTQVGTASWYGSQFHGRKTSSGEKYDKNIMTAAHPTLPIPSYAKVVNLKNGKSVIVRINDRGPFHSSRVMDLSQAAAQKLGFINSGTAKVSIEQVVPGPNMQPTQEARNIYVDLQRFNNVKDAQSYLTATSRHLQQANSEHKAVMVKVNNNYVVRMGPFQKQERADSVKKSMLTAI